MSAEPRLSASAVAKRRKLNKDNLPTTSSASAHAQSGNEILEQNQECDLPSSSGTVRKARPPVRSKPKPLNDDGNPFSALSDGDTVSLGFTREIEPVHKGSVKVRLSQDQMCIVSGTYYLRVESGIIDLAGARLEASSKTYEVFSPINYDVPHITVLSKIAEFQLDTTTGSLPPGFPDSYFTWRIPGTKQILQGSFHVSGCQLKYNPSYEQRIGDFDSESVEPLHEDLSQSWKLMASLSVTAPKILVCGRHTNSTGAQTMTIINGILTEVSEDGSPLYPQGLILLDLDLCVPEFSPAGTVSLVHVTAPVFAPPYLRASATGGSETAQMLRMLYTARAEDAVEHVSRLGDMLESIPEDCKACPIVIKASDILEYMLLEDINTFADRISPTQIVCLGHGGSSASCQAGESIARHRDCPLFKAPAAFSRNPPLPDQHELLMRSYFHLQEHSGERPQWSAEPVLTGNDGCMRLSYSQANQIIDSVLFCGGQVPLSITIEMMEHSFVAVVVSPNVAHSRGKCEDENDSTHHPRHLTGGVPRRVGSDEESASMALGTYDCLGLGFVTRIDTHQEVVHLRTPIPESTFTQVQSKDRRVMLIVQRCDPDGRFSTCWVHQEIET